MGFGFKKRLWISGNIKPIHQVLINGQRLSFSTFHASTAGWFFRNSLSGKVRPSWYNYPCQQVPVILLLKGTSYVKYWIHMLGYSIILDYIYVYIYNYIYIYIIIYIHIYIYIYIYIPSKWSILGSSVRSASASRPSTPAHTMGRTGAGEPGAAKGDVASWCWGSKMME